MSFNPDPNKQATEVCFSNRRDKGNYPPLHFNRWRLGSVLDSKLNFNKNTESKIIKFNKIIGFMKKLSQFRSRNSALAIYKSFVRPNHSKRKLKWSNATQRL